MKLLHVIASPRGPESTTFQVARAFVEDLQVQHGDVQVEVLDLFDRQLPSVAGDNLTTKYRLMSGQPVDPDHLQAWAAIEELIEGFTSADAYVFSVPMWNFGIPYALKHYIDCIVQPGYTFAYDQSGRPQGLVHGKQAVFVTARGSDYSSDPMKAYDLQEPYLRAIFGFMGVTDCHFIHAEPMNISPQMRTAALGSSLDRARLLASGPQWTREAAVTSVG